MTISKELLDELLKGVERPEDFPTPIVMQGQMRSASGTTMPAR
ncbi:hypothetical protein [Pseudogemmobacter faecipullorum]|nr:hypothetical protein [Pseudogemmobacter faecipullorum]